MSNRHKELFKDFEPHSKVEWINITKEQLKGEDVFSKFSWHPEPDLTMLPYYDSSDISFKKNNFDNRLFKTNQLEAPARKWDNFQLINSSTTQAANKQGIEAINQGATGLIFNLQNIEDVDFECLLEGINATKYSISFSITEHAEKHLDNYVRFIDKNKYNPSEIRGIILNNNKRLQADKLADYPLNNLHTLEIKVDAQLTYTDSIAQALLQLIEIIENIKYDSIENVFIKLFFNIPLGTKYFEEIARVQTIRRLTYQIASAYGCKHFLPEDLYLLGSSPPWITKNYEPQSNLLKTTTSAMAAIIGGCNGLLLSPSDPESALLKRIALNTSTILQEEAYLNTTNDPVAGTYYLENMIDQMSQVAWKKFQNVI
ncbi:methylmalonyl-CoA mutase family protein [Fulvivirga maritima]|uniref:methylmalonyl-CoA mutase family protein n=1 Tax=Fulvivirga maritima TaxID=2904247 RepID=UPI001F337082|nr:methylmalonyl-CoA mutase family protein [Fulvivirga maritima]UII29366.1 methylmalonyl-CoA mutase family protein [Fulvivirga maritima]